MKLGRSALVPARLAAIAVAALPAAAHAEEGRPPSAEERIVITATRVERIGDPAATRESVDRERLATTTSMRTSDDALRYLPSLFVRRRHIGDLQATLATRTSGVGAGARSLVYADGILLSALIGNNNSNASPRWGMVSPEEIESVEVLYGPFSAAYPGNSIGAVVTIATRAPDGPEGSVRAASSVQRFSQYGTDGVYPSLHLAATAGDRHGGFSWFASANRLAATGQPLAYVTVPRPASTGAAGTPVTGAYPDLNRSGAPIFVIGAGGIEHQAQETLKLRLGFDAGSGLKLGYRGGLFLARTRAEAETYLSGGSGPVYSGALDIDGRAATVPASAFSNNVYRLAQRHEMHALTAEGAAGILDWQAVASLYRFDKDAQRGPSGALPAAADGGPGSILRLDGTGWRTLDWKAALGRGARAPHRIAFGAHWDRFDLRSRRYATDDWLAGANGALLQAAEGRTGTIALWAQDRWALAPSVDITLGGRFEWWRASRGFNFSQAPALSAIQPSRTARGFSPKATFRWQAAPSLRLAASAGIAYRFPTVSELYQAVSTGPTLTVPDPTLRPERARSGELSVEWAPPRARLRLSLFDEHVRDALLSQTAPLVPGSTTLFSYVQNVGLTRTRGAELVFEARGFLLPKLDLSGSVTLADARVLRDPAFAAAEGRHIPQVPALRAALALTWRESDKASFTLAGRYSSRSFATIDNSDTVTHTYQGFDPYLVIDARAAFRLGRGWEAAIAADNVTDRRYFVFHPFPQRTVHAEIGWRW